MRLLSGAAYFFACFVRFVRIVRIFCMSEMESFPNPTRIEAV